MKTSDKIGLIALACGVVAALLLGIMGAALWICVVAAVAVFGLIDSAARKNVALNNVANLNDRHRR